MKSGFRGLIKRIFSTRQAKDSRPETQPRISVIIPFYNNHDYLPECLESIRRHIATSYEVIIVDDGSPDTRYLKSLKDPCIEVIYLEGQSGPSKARNIGIARATGEYLLFLDSDDTLADNPGILIDRAANIPHGKGADILVGQEVDSASNRGLRARKAPFVTNLKSDPQLARLHFFFALLYRRNTLLQKKILFREDLSSGGDLAFLAEALAQAAHIFADRLPFYRYRRRENSITHSILKKQYVECRLKMINHVAEHLSRHPEAATLRSLSIFKTNLNMVRRATRDLGEPVGRWFLEGLLAWTSLYLADDTLIKKVQQSYYVGWGDFEAGIMSAIRSNSSTDQIFEMITKNS